MGEGVQAAAPQASGHGCEQCGGGQRQAGEPGGCTSLEQHERHEHQHRQVAARERRPREGQPEQPPGRAPRDGLRPFRRRFPFQEHDGDGGRQQARRPVHDREPARTQRQQDGGEQAPERSGGDQCRPEHPVDVVAAAADPGQRLLRRGLLDLEGQADQRDRSQHLHGPLRGGQDQQCETRRCQAGGDERPRREPVEQHAAEPSGDQRRGPEDGQRRRREVGARQHGEERHHVRAELVDHPDGYERLRRTRQISQHEGRLRSATDRTPPPYHDRTHV